MNSIETTATMARTRGKSRACTACTDSQPSPGQAKIVSVTTAPPRSAPNCSPMTVTTGRSAFGSAWRIDHQPLGQPLAPRGQAVLVGQHLEHAGPERPGDARHRVEPERHRRQDQAGRVELARRGQPAQAHREHHHQHDAEPEERDGLADQRQHPPGVVGQRARPGRREDADRHRDQDGEGHRRRRQLEGRRQPLADDGRAPAGGTGATARGPRGRRPARSRGTGARTACRSPAPGGAPRARPGWRSRSGASPRPGRRRCAASPRRRPSRRRGR